MKRREFLTMLGGTAAMGPLAARAQSAAVPVIGFLGNGSAAGYADRVRAFRQGLGEAGYVEGRNVAIEFRWAEGQYGRLPALAADLVSRQVKVIAAVAGIPAVQAAKKATATIPIVFVLASDPVVAGIVVSLNRPGSNVTGVTTLNVDVGPKRLELMHELVPRATSMALLVNPTNPNATTLSKDLLAAARTFGMELHTVHASTEQDFDNVFSKLIQLKAGGLVIGPDALFTAQNEHFIALTIRHAMPTLSPYREFVTAGGLISYGASATDASRLVGIYCARILKGDKPTDLPVQRSTKIEMSINLKTAKAFGLTVPLTLLGRADEVIE